MRRLVVLAGPGGAIRPGLLSPAILGRRAGPSPEPSSEPPIEGVRGLEELEAEMIRRALAKASGNKAVAARLLKVSKSTLYAKLHRLGLA